MAQLLMFLCFLCAFSQVLPIDIDETHYTIEDYICFNRTGIDKSYMDSHVTADFVLTTGDEKLNKFMACWVVEMKLVDDELQFSHSAWEKYATHNLFKFIGKSDYPNKEELAKKFVNDCKTIESGSDLGNSAILMLNCMLVPFLELMRTG
ncbi:hypothetical protein PPYR_13582 [Photinus pyralis]|uniref:Uncharacterized protein n=2 Tax=Photinus pyralis TaxID=7054 RepID=A0A5N4A9G5_PHOPY|nr:uncharacterized protein LOC116179125 [Photinus pyralis]XP_031354708.1 uncharacterized protein LOC116179133 [Photinus pyralis]KAB0793962.1 hypothetical protein PPYR_13582 [Photinus pyralis]